MASSQEILLDPMAIDFGEVQLHTEDADDDDAEIQQQVEVVALTSGSAVEEYDIHSRVVSGDLSTSASTSSVDKQQPASALPPIPFSFPGQTFDTKCQKLILNVWDFFKRVKKNPDILDEIRTPQERAAAALHISAATIGKIGKNLKKTGKLETPGKKRSRSRPIVDSVDAGDELVIKQIIAEYRNSK
jgi:hypothetical protein